MNKFLREAYSKTLEELVHGFQSLINLFEQEKEGEKQKESEEDKDKKILIHYYPGKELFVLIGEDKIIAPQGVKELPELFEKIKELRLNQDIAGIKALLTPKTEQEKKEEKAAIDFIEKVKEVVDETTLLLSTGDFEVKGDSVYMKGIDRSLPKLMVKKFKELVPVTRYSLDDYQALKNFWYWCSLNPVAPVVDNLYDFLSKNYLRLNKNGFFYAIRNVDKVEGAAVDKGLVDFISSNYVRIRMNKKAPKNYTVLMYESGYKCIPNNRIEEEKYFEHSNMGNLQELYTKLPEMEENRYTDNWTKTMDIRIGRPVKMDPKKCHWDSVDCGDGGLHFTLNISNYNCGDTALLILINPAKVVGFGSNKGRCYEYLPLCTMERREADKMLRSGKFDTTSIEDVNYEEEMKDLETKVKESFTAEVKKHTLLKRYNYKVSSTSEAEVHNIVEKLQVNMASRVKSIV